MHIKQQSWTDRQTLLSLILTNLAGGDCVDDLRKLQGDSGFCKVLRRIEQKGMKRRERRELDRRWRKEQGRAVPSSSSVFRYLAAFHDAAQEKLRIQGISAIYMRFRTIPRTLSFGRSWSARLTSGTEVFPAWTTSRIWSTRGARARVSAVESTGGASNRT